MSYGPIRLIARFLELADFERSTSMWRWLILTAFGLLVSFPLALRSSGAADDEPGVITTMAGTGTAGFSGDGGKAAKAQLNLPFHCDLDADGNLYIVDTGNNRIRKFNFKTGLIATVAGNGQSVPAHTGDGGPALQAPVSSPYAVAALTNGDFYIVEQRTPVVRRVDGKTGIITTVAGTGKKGYGGDGGPGVKAELREPNDCCLDGKGGLLIADVQDWRVRRLDLKTGIITTIAGSGRPKELAPGAKLKVDRTKIGDGGKATDAVIVGARAVHVDGKGNTYICEREGCTIRKVDAQGIITTIAGTGASGYSGDGQHAAKATFKSPKGVRCDAHGNIYVVDSDNNAIRKIDARTNIVTTVAGGRLSGEGDGGDATKAGLDWPHGCVVGPDGVLYIADSRNHRIRAVAP
jgi:sugar lactone lactonase YvrE